MYAFVTFDPVHIEPGVEVELVVDGNDDELDQIQKRWLSGRETRPCGAPTRAQLDVIVEDE